MRKRILITAYALVAFFTIARATDDQQQQVLVAVGKMLSARHYHPKVIDDAFSQEVWRKYLEQLDPDKRIFLQEDITALAPYATTLDDEILGKMPIAFLPAALDIFTKRAREAADRYRQLLAGKLPAAGTGETLRRNMDYAGSTAMRKHYSSKYIQYLVLKNLVLLQDRHTGQTAAQLQEQARFITGRQLERVFKGLITNLTTAKQFPVFVNVIVHAMDPHTDYFPPADQQAFMDVMRNRFIGIGVQLQQEEGIIKIISLEPGGPAWRSGQLQANDYIIQVGEGVAGAMEDITGMTQAEVSNLIRGVKGTTVRLELRKEDGSVKTVALVRDEIVQEEGFARAAIIQRNGRRTGYIMLPKFYIDVSGKTDVHCAGDVAKALTALEKEHVDGVVLDLRSNGGGSLEEVIRMVGLFIKAGPVVQVKDNAGHILALKDRDSSQLYKGALVVMVNELSASAAEIFAAAIQDYHRGIIIGSNATYGKGTVQGTFALEAPAAGSLKLTYEQFYRISGGSTQLKGVIPDIILPDTYAYLKVREKDNAAALAWDQVAKADYIPWNGQLDIAVIKQRMDAQIATDTVFSRLRDISHVLADSTYNQRLLNLAEYRVQQAAHKRVQQQVKYLQRLPTGSTLEVLPLNGTAASANYRQWLQQLSTDVYIDKAVIAIGDTK